MCCQLISLGFWFGWIHFLRRYLITITKRPEISLRWLGGTIYHLLLQSTHHKNHQCLTLKQVRDTDENTRRQYTLDSTTSTADLSEFEPLPCDFGQDALLLWAVVFPPVEGVEQEPPLHRVIVTVRWGNFQKRLNSRPLSTEQINVVQSICEITPR